MSFPDIRAELDDKAFALWRGQIASTKSGDPVVRDSSGLVSSGLELVRTMPPIATENAMAKHLVEHAYKTARNRTKNIGKRVIARLFRGEWPLEMELDDATYTMGPDHYPLRYLTYPSYSEIIDDRLRQAKHDFDRMTGANESRLALAATWADRMLGEVVAELDAGDDA